MIHVKNLRFSYPGADKETLRGLDFSIRQGEIFGFLGPSGAGKSTLQKILIGILKPYKGSVNIFDEEIAVCGPDYYERIGVAFEFPNFYSKFTALENLKLFKALYQCRTEDPMIMLEKVGLVRCIGIESVTVVQRDENAAEFLSILYASSGSFISR